MDILIHPTYFPTIAHFVAIINAETITFEMDDNFQKQTYRNRTYIYGANGKLLLNIPVIHTQKTRQKYRNVKVYNEENWQSQHWKSLESAYRTSPFFEFYEDELQPLFHEEVTNLLDFNLKCFNTVCECLQIDLTLFETKVYHKEITEKSDYRYLVNAKRESPPVFEAYTQVFDDKHGYINNLSILDLLFNEGPNTVNYLETQSFPW